MASFGEEVLSALPTEARNEKTMRLDELSTLEMLTVMNAEDALVAAAVQAALPEIAAAVDAIAARFALGGRLFYVGQGRAGGWECSMRVSVRRRFLWMRDYLLA